MYFQVADVATGCRMDHQCMDLGLGRSIEVDSVAVSSLEPFVSIAEHCHRAFPG